MAEIRVERVQKRGLGWLWALLLVLLLAAVAWYLWANGYFGVRTGGAAADSTRTSLGAPRAIGPALRHTVPTVPTVPVVPSHIA
jgi:hypothetical protein